jgi:uncharacterized cupin superfamily protein
VEIAMPEDQRKRCLLKAAEIEGMAAACIRHPLNPDSEVHLRPLSELTGLGRVRLTLGRIPPGKESFAYHAHEADEEFVYILSGRGSAEIGDETVEVGPGDFMGFAAPSVAHHLKNPYDEDLVYLMGGERSRVEVGTFPRAGKRIIFSASGIWQVDENDLKPMGPDDWLVGAPKDDG